MTTTPNSEENITELNSEGNVTQMTGIVPIISTEPKIPTKALTKTILLGFAKFIYIRKEKVFTFFTYFGTIKKVVITQILYISISIRYKSGLRRIQEQNKEAKCLPEESTIDNLIKYKCSYETSGEDIDNIQVNDKNLSNGDIEIETESPLAVKYKDNLQNIGDTDIFDGKELYILNDAHVESENNKFNITGEINKNSFNYDTLDLMITLYDDPKEEIKNIPCKINKTNQNILTLNCESDQNLRGSVKGSFSSLIDGNLLVDIKDGEDGDITLTNEEKSFYQNPRKGDKKKLSGGAIAAIVLSIVALLIIIALMVKFGCKKSKPVEQSPNAISYSSANIYQN
jgi:hypothetical protein